MPRRMVDPANRLRASQACVQCRASKKRCDARLPCSKCIEKGLQDSCTFAKRSSVTTSSSVSQAPRSTSIDELSQQRGGSAGAITPQQPSLDQYPHPTFARNDESNSSMSPVVDIREDAPGEARHRLQPRLLSNSRGERVFIGSSASLAFLQFISDLVAGSIGVPDFTQGTETTCMLEATQPLDDHDDLNFQVDAQTKLQYGHNFCIVTKGLIGFVKAEELTGILELDPSVPPPSDPQNATIANLILAIGAQCAPASHVQARIEKHCLALARAAAFSGMVESPSRGTIKVFLMLAFYMLQACRRNAAFMYIGIASRAVYALGIHYSECKGQDSNIWKSLVNVDLTCSSILGRAPASLLQHNDNNHSRGLDALPHDAPNDALNANFQMSEMVHEIVSILYRSHSVTTEAAERYLEMLTDWSESLPQSLRLDETPRTADHTAWERVVGCLYVSCYYHFAVILVCRPFLISQLLSHLLSERTPGGHLSHGLEFKNEQDREILAKKCVTAATYMAQTCIEVLEADFLLESAPLLKAWIFAAGLVLGLQMFVLDRSDSETEAAFWATRTVLRKLGARSAQASHYYDILGHLGSVVTKKRAERTLQGRSRRGSISKMVNLSGGRNKAVAHAMPNLEEDFTTNPLPMSADPGPDFGGINSLLFSMQDDLINYDDIVLGWDQLASQI